MKLMLVIFSWFSVATDVTICANVNWSNSWRTRLGLNIREVFEFSANVTKQFEGFGYSLDREYNEFGDFSVRPGTSFVETAADVSRVSRDIAHAFMVASYAYFALNSTEYFTLAERLVNDCRDYDEVVRAQLDVRRLIGMQHPYGFCMLGAFHDGGIDIERALDGVVFSLSAYHPTRMSLGRGGMMKLLRAYGRQHRDITGNPEHGSRIDETRFRAVKRSIVDFSGTFCTRWTPIVGDFVLAEYPIEHIQRHGTVFIRHLLENEQCSVYNSQEYGIKKYTDDVTRFMRIHHLKRRKTSLTENAERSFSLTALKEKFNYRYYRYGNLVNYYNIGSDLILYVSIREGTKILKGIKSVVTLAIIYNVVNIDEILEARSTLYAFKCVFDRLVDFMLRHGRVDVTENSDKKAFEDKVNSLLKSLDIRGKGPEDKTAILEMCTEVSEVVLPCGESDQYRGFNGNNEYSDFLYNEFYLTLPILYIDQLYRFYVNDFW